MSQIKFCPRCNNNFSNFTVSKTEDGEQVLLYKCKTCIYTEPVSNIDQINQATIFKKQNLTKKPNRPINVDLCDDASMPHTSAIPCANKSCPSHKDEEYDIIYVDYNEDRKLAYICCKCKHSWKVE